MVMDLGVVADDFTGGSDIALMLARGGMRVVQHIGVPDAAAPVPSADAVVVSLKSRTTPAAEAVARSVAAARALRAAGARQLFFKYCSTFDSTDAGNIGPVAEALAELTGAAIVPFCPAFPSNGRSVYQGHLFVGRQLLSDSPMRDHPLTPMRDADLVRVLARQTRHKVGLIPLAVVARGPVAIRAAYGAAVAAGERFVIVDALDDGHLAAIAAASAALPLITGGSGVAVGLADNARRVAGLGPADAAPWSAPAGARLILAGSCSAATRGQIAAALAAGLDSLKLDAATLDDPAAAAASVAAWARPRLGDRPLLIYSSADPEEVRAVQERLGVAAAGARVERCLAEVARLLVAAGVRQLIVAGGETSGAVVAGLGAVDLAIGPEIAPGVPWVRTDQPLPLALAMKSGNFGGPHFFLEAWEKLA
jgi:uncharacterized protein YgbK (DUF1537 family)